MKCELFLTKSSKPDSSRGSGRLLLKLYTLTLPFSMLSTATVCSDDRSGRFVQNEIIAEPALEIRV